MVEPPWWLSLVLVLLAVPGRPVGSAADRRGATAAGALAAAVAVGALAVVALAEAQLRAALQVTAPSVRLAAGVAVGVVALGRVLALVAARRPDTDTGTDTDTDPGGIDPGTGPAMAARTATAARRLPGGPLRVEVAVAVWSLAADHGAALGLLAALLCAPLDLTDAAGLRRSTRRLIDGRAARTARATGALVVAVLVAINGILGL